MNITANSPSELDNKTAINSSFEEISDEEDCSNVNNFECDESPGSNEEETSEVDIAKFSKFTMIGQTLILKKTSPRFRDETKIGRKNQKNEQLICIYCKTRSSRTWRKGPDGRKSLCNSCGLRYYRILVKERKILPSNTPNPIQSILN